MDENFKHYAIAFIIGLVLGAAVTGVWGVVSGFGRAGSIDTIAEDNRRSTNATVTELRGTVEQQRARIDDLETSNRRLEEYLMGAGRICKSLAGTVAAGGANTASAAQVSARLRAGIEALENWYNSIGIEYGWSVGLGIE